MSSDDIYHAAVAYLSLREHGHMELKEKLLRKDFDEDKVDDLLQQLIDNGLLSEQRYVDGYIRSYASRGVGPVKIRLKLLQKRVATDQITLGFDRCGEDWQMNLHRVWFKKYGGKQPTDARAYQQQVRFLSQRGFTHESIAKLLLASTTDN